MSGPSPSEEPKTEEPKSNSTTPPDFGWNLNQTLNQLIGFADFKAGALLGATAVIIVLLLPNKPTHPPSGIPVIMYYLALFFLALCALCAGCAFLPFLRPRSRGDKYNPVFWKSIRHHNKQECYLQCVAKLNDSTVNDHYAKENYQISKDLMWRFTLVESSIVALIFGLVFVALFFLFPK